MRIAIVEDDDSSAQKLRQFLTEFEKTEPDVSFQITRYTGGLAFLDDYKEGFDVVFMDIVLPDTNGLEASKRLRKIDSNVFLVFVTNMEQFAVKGYEVNAFDYIVKPVAYYNFFMKMQRLVDAYKLLTVKKVPLKTSDCVVFVPTNEIKYVEVSGHIAIYYTVKGNYQVRTTLKKAESELPDYFAKCNSCYLVNLNFVNKLDGIFVYVDGVPLQISQHKRAEFVRKLNYVLNH